MHSLSFLAANLLVLVGASRGLSLFRLDSWLDRVLALATLALTQVVLALLAAGAMHRLESTTVLVIEVVLSGGLIFAARNRPRPTLRAHSSAVAPSRLVALARTHPWPSGLAVLATAALAWRVVLAYVLPPYAYDALTYHLTAVATWLQAGRFVQSPLNGISAYYPANGELTFAWSVLFLRSDAIVDMVQIAFALIGALAVGGIARIAGLRDRNAVIAASVFILTPIVLAQANTNDVDVMFASSYLVALYFVLRFFEARQANRACRTTGTGECDSIRPQTTERLRGFLVLAGLWTGFVLGIKGTGILYAAVLSGFLVSSMLVAWLRNAARPADLVNQLALFMSATLTLGGFWYARNWIVHGNPAYPFDVRALGLHLFRGQTYLREVIGPPAGYRGDSWWKLVLVSWRSDLGFWHRPPYTYTSPFGGLGPQWSYLGVPLSLPFLIQACRRRPLFLSFAVPVALTLALTPYKWWSRFTLLLAAIGAIALAHYGSQRSPFGNALKLVLTVFLLAGVWLASVKVNPEGYGRVLGVRDIVRLFGKPSSDRTIGALFFREYRWVDRLPDDASIYVEQGAHGVRFDYPLFGSSLQHRVYHVPSGVPSDLVAAERDPSAAYVFLGEGGSDDRLARANRSCFRLIFEGAQGRPGNAYYAAKVRAYRVLPGCRRGLDGG